MAENLHYITIYEIASDPIQGLLQYLNQRPDFWFLFLIISLPTLVMLVTYLGPGLPQIVKKGDTVAQRVRFQSDRPIFRAFGALFFFAVLVVLPVFRYFVVFPENRALAEEYKNNKCIIAEGTISNLVHGSNLHGPFTLRFKVYEHEIGFSNNSPGYASPTNEVLRNGQTVRIWAKSFDRHRVLTPLNYWWPKDDSVEIARIDIWEQDIRSHHP